MAINKTAKNIKIEITNNYISFAKKLYETGGIVEIVATKENLTLTSGNKVNIQGNKS